MQLLNHLMEYLLLCVGNRDGGDDAIGPYIADKIKQKENISVIDCGISPENYTSDVKRIKPKKLIIIDATDMNLSPGEIRLIPEEKIGTMHISTHGIPLSIVMKYLKDYAGQILFVGIQPKTMNGPITEIVKKSGDYLIEIILKDDLKKIKML